MDQQNSKNAGQVQPDRSKTPNAPQPTQGQSTPNKGAPTTTGTPTDKRDASRSNDAGSAKTSNQPRGNEDQAQAQRTDRGAKPEDRTQGSAQHSSDVEMCSACGQPMPHNKTDDAKKGALPQRTGSIGSPSTMGQRTDDRGGNKDKSREGARSDAPAKSGKSDPSNDGE